MAEQHPIWRGYLRLALVSCPVALYTARHAAAELHFHYINPKTGHRVRMITLDAGTDEEVQRRDLVKGYEFEKDTYVLLDDQDFDRARIESSSQMTLDKFVPDHAINPVFYDNSYFMAPDGEAGQDVFVVLRDAIGQSRHVALTRVVIARRERAAVIMPMGRGLVLHTLHDERDLHDSAPIFAQVPKAKPEPAMVTLAGQLIERQIGPFDPADMEDRYETKLRAVIDAKLQGHPMEPPPEPEADRGNVVDLMALLKRSLGQDAPAAKRGRTAAKAPVKKKSPATSPSKRAVVRPAAKTAPKRKRAS